MVAGEIGAPALLRRTFLPGAPLQNNHHAERDDYFKNWGA
jgi:hypothetical protein